MLKPADIEQKTFSTALRGYDLNEVDDFLDEVIATIRDLEGQVESSQSGKPAAAKHDPVHDESAVGRALIAAQAAADRLLEEAREEADRIRAEARTDADSWVNEREAMKSEAEREMTELTKRVSHVRRELAVLATAVADGLDEMDAAIEGAAALSLMDLAEEPALATVDEVSEITEEVVTEVIDHETVEVWEEDDDSGDLWVSEDSAESADSPEDDEDDDEEDGEDDGDDGDDDEDDD